MPRKLHLEWRENFFPVQGERWHRLSRGAVEPPFTGDIPELSGTILCHVLELQTWAFQPDHSRVLWWQNPK